MTRRDVLRLGGLTLPLSGCMHPRPQAKLLRSLAPLPAPFECDLPRIPVAGPNARQEYEFAVQPAESRILPGLAPQIWGFNGIFPGPTSGARPAAANTAGDSR